MKENKITWRNLNPKMKKCWLIKGATGLIILLCFFTPPLIYGLISGSKEMIMGSIPVIIIFIGIFSAYVMWVELFYPRYSYAVTDEGVLIKRGVLWKSFRTIPYGRIQHVSIDRGPIEQLLGLHSMNIFTAGTGSLGSSSMSKGMWGAEGYIPGLVEPEKLKSEIMGRVKPTSFTSGLGEETPTFESTINILVEEAKKIRELLERK
ncbi:MAG: PH domain-containing protein [Thermoplasmatales archaeon]|nr:PH domain-containing protein [Thermoplasmatales archaeon]